MSNSHPKKSKEVTMFNYVFLSDKTHLVSIVRHDPCDLDAGNTVAAYKEAA